ncbi:hypothetical protein Pmar_PMAR018354 [Perkinsus marinus ATCC 50983]|uniref:Uncharacterized protein n=1 Tax=Perkinsus marinus (strain ATCC 50983 / TXsc) TaxID=423536 RepID=C5LRZ9_PERM5|nr:hypothetical protein Pmar_PMAR018354 [Perkinsus marinus ATCC 50983]EER00471.1 hypothetical protein Pmar_PMAR018354 [Perkinsus marinus ATCC 50983]|eukprot:XP_002767753.1 hypothetical protein Pmar_PMAR018354 [Perkinsus marinus ATCC 50983]
MMMLRPSGDITDHSISLNIEGASLVGDRVTRKSQVNFPAVTLRAQFSSGESVEDSGSCDVFTSTESSYSVGSKRGSRHSLDAIVLCNDMEKSALTLSTVRDILQGWLGRDNGHRHYEVRVIHLCTMAVVVSDSAQYGFADCVTSCSCSNNFTNLISSWEMPLEVRVQSVVPTASALDEVLHLSTRVLVTPYAVHHRSSTSRRYCHSKVLKSVLRQVLTLADDLEPPKEQFAILESSNGVSEEELTSPLPEAEHYRAVLLLASEKWEPVVDWGIRLVKPGENIKVVHFIRGPEVANQSAEMQLMARRRARLIDPSILFDIHVVRVDPGDFLTRVVELSKKTEFLVVGDSGRVQTRHRDIILKAQCDVILARSVIPPTTRSITNMVVGVGARDSEGAMNALGLAYRVAEISEDDDEAAVHVAGIFVPVVMHADNMLKGQWQLDRRAVLVNGTSSVAVLHRVEQFVARQQTDTVSFHLEMEGYSDSLQVAHRLLLRTASVESEEAEAPPLLFVGAGSSSTAGQLGSVIEYLTGPKRGERAIHSTTVAIAKLRRCGIPYHKQQVEAFVTKVTWNTSTETFV